MNILGISCYYHDAAAALVQDGVIVSCALEERFSRKKHDASFPSQAIDFCLEAGTIGKHELDYVVFYEKPFRKLHRLLHTVFVNYPYSYGMFLDAIPVVFGKKLWIKDTISSYLKIHPDKVLFVAHHLSHAASCFYPSPFHTAAILTVDGVGEWTTTAFGTGEESQIILQKELHYPHSLGLLYSAFTAFLGFEVNEGEWKVMGMAAYGTPRYRDKIRQIVKLHDDGSFTLDLSYFSFHYSTSRSYSQKFIEMFGNPISQSESHIVTARSADIAASIQAFTEEVLIRMVQRLKKGTKQKNLCFAGGVALNSLANYRILKEGGFQNIYIPPDPGDAGGAMGSALYVYHQITKKNKRTSLFHVYVGKAYTNDAIKKFLETNRVQYRIYSRQQLITYVVNQLCAGRVIGWMQGRFEFGPRALGARSILADARNPSMKDIVNKKVKFRESFRPFAPSVLAEKASDVFDLPAYPSRHIPLRMMQYIVPVKQKWRKIVPAINHEDNTSRPQLVFKEDNPLFYDLLQAFYEKTGVPLILNTSFNIRGEPIVNSPKDALRTFQASGIDVLVMGNSIVKKENIPSEDHAQ